MDIISYSLYGSQRKYLVGALRNVEIAKDLYPNWTCRLYCGISVPERIKSQLVELGAEVIDVVGREDASAMFWRFRVVKDLDVELTLLRDCDSRPDKRELTAVDQWIASGKDIHIIRDHPMHNAPILGGLWGARVNRISFLGKALDEYLPIGRYGEDQEFLAKVLGKKIKNDAYIHDAYFLRNWKARRITLPRVEGAYLGESYSEHDEYSKARRWTVVRLEKSIARRVHLMLKDTADRFVKWFTR